MKAAIPLCLGLLLAAPAVAEPPDHAPAHGYRNKGGKQEDKARRRFRGYTGTEWVADHGVLSGRCNTEEVLTAVGAIGGAVIGNRVAEPGDRLVATLVGAIAGGVIGNRIGDAIDDRDRACMGYSLEMAPIGRAVTWTNPASGRSWRVVPVEDLRSGCRRFEYGPGNGRGDRQVACRDGNGAWRLRS
jgi:surface antigen